MADNETVESEKSGKRRVGRSPAYPFISVKKALEKAKALMDQEGEYAAPLASAFAAWGYGAKSSGGRQTLATLKYYGLIEISGDGDARKVKVSDIGRRILLDEREDQTEKRALIRRVALTPVANKQIYDQYPNGLASDQSVRHFLMFDLHFKPEAAAELLRQFKTTASHARLYQPDNSVDKAVDQDDTEEQDKEPPAIGDKIQWTSMGVDQFPNLATVLGFSDDGQWVFTDQSAGGCSINEVTVMERAASTPPDPQKPPPPPPPPHVLAAMQAIQKQNALDAPEEGVTVLTRGKLKSGSFEVRVKGEIGAKEIGKIVKLLQAQQAILSDDDDDDDEKGD